MQRSVKEIGENEIKLRCNYPVKIEQSLLKHAVQTDIKNKINFRYGENKENDK